MENTVILHDGLLQVICKNMLQHLKGESLKNVCFEMFRANGVRAESLNDPPVRRFLKSTADHTGMLTQRELEEVAKQIVTSKPRPGRRIC